MLWLSVYRALRPFTCQQLQMGGVRLGSVAVGKLLAISAVRLSSEQDAHLALQKEANNKKQSERAAQEP